MPRARQNLLKDKTLSKGEAIKARRLNQAQDTLKALYSAASSGATRSFVGPDGIVTATSFVPTSSFCIIVDIKGPQSPVVDVQIVVRKELGVYERESEVLEIECWPGTMGIDYLPMLDDNLDGDVDRTITVLEIRNVDDTDYVYPQGRRHRVIIRPEQRFGISDAQIEELP